MRAAGLLCSEGGLVGSVSMGSLCGSVVGREAGSVHGAEVRHPAPSVSFRKLNVSELRKRKVPWLFISPLP